MIIFATAKLQKMLKSLAIVVLIIAICVVLLSVKIIFKKGGTFPSMHIHDNKAMSERGIHCVLDQDREARKKGRSY